MNTLRQHITCVLLLGTIALALPALAQPPTLLLLEGDPLPGAPGRVIQSINNSAVNHDNGFAFGLNSSDGVTTLSHFWGGHGNGLDGAILRTEGTFGQYEQTSFETFYGITNLLDIAYSPIANNLDTGSTGLDGVWLNDDPIAVEEEPYPHMAGWYWRFGSRPAATADGVIYWVGGITDTQGGSTDNYGLFYSAAATPLLLGGQNVTGLPEPLSTVSTISFDYRFSALGTYYLGEVQVEASTAINNAMVIGMPQTGTAEVLMAGGSPVREGTVIPPAVGGSDGEAWDNFDYVGITESGSWFLTGDTDGDVTKDEIVVKDGHIILREGQVLAGEVLTGAIEGGYMNESGDLVLIWDIQSPIGDLEALFVNGVLMAKEGDPVDLDGDMVPEVGTAITNFTGISTVTISDRGADDHTRVYFTADVEIPVPGAPRPLAGEPLVAGDESGLTAEEAAALAGEDDPGRAVLEGAFVIAIPTVVPVTLSAFDIVPVAHGMRISWQLFGEPADLRLTGRQGQRTWEVPITAGPEGSFTALDDLRAAAPGRDISYSLHLRRDQSTWVLLTEQRVRGPVPQRAAAIESVLPNPFNPQTNIVLYLERSQEVRLTILDLSGRLVRELATGLQPAGRQTIVWDGADLAGRPVSSGSYLLKLESEGSIESRKLMLVR